MRQAEKRRYQLYHKQIPQRQHGRARQRRELDRRAAAAAVRVVEQCAGGVVVDDPVKNIVGRRADLEHDRGERAGCQAKRGEDGIVQLDLVVHRREAADLVLVGGGIRRSVETVSVLTRIALQIVIAALAVQDVVSRIADQIIHLPVAACGVDAARALQIDALNAGCGREAHSRQHIIANPAAARDLVGDIGNIVDIIIVIAETAAHRVNAAFAVKHIIARIAEQEVHLRVAAGGVDVGRPLQVNPLNAGGGGEAHRRQDIIANPAAAGGLVGDVGDVVDIIIVIAKAAAHRVNAAFAVKRIVAGIADEKIRLPVAARGIDVCCALQGQPLNPRRRCVTHRRKHLVKSPAAAGDVVGHIADIVDIIDIVAEPAAHRVDAASAVKAIIAGIADEEVHLPVAANGVDVGGPLQINPLNASRRREADRRQHIIADAAAAGLAGRVADIVDIIIVVAEAAKHAVSASPAVDCVIEARSGDGFGIAVACDQKAGGAGISGEGEAGEVEGCGGPMAMSKVSLLSPNVSRFITALRAMPVALNWLALSWMVVLP